uniref:WXG100-like domain-containing protein n=1 Tax=Micromonospora sp. TaxID=1876 RepID=UPI003B3B54EE
MAIEVSAELANFLRFLVGEKFPKADETNLFATAEALRQAAEQVATSSETFGDGVRAYRAGVNGQAEDSFVDTMERYVLHSPGYLGLVSKYTNRMGDSYRGTATEVQYAKLMIIAALLALMVELLTALAIAWINPGAALARLAVGRVIMRVIFQNVTTRVLFQVAMAQAVGIGLQTVMDRLVQLYQIRNHTRDGWNNELTRAAAEVGSLGGAVGLGLGGLMQGLERLVRSTNIGRRVGLTASSNTPDPHGFRPGEAAQEVANEGISEWLTEFVYNGMTTGEWDADGAAVVAGALSGVASVAGTAIGQQLNKATSGDRDRKADPSALADPVTDEQLPAYDPVRLPAYHQPPSYAEAVTAVPGAGAGGTGTGGAIPGGPTPGGAIPGGAIPG